MSQRVQPTSRSARLRGPLDTERPPTGAARWLALQASAGNRAVRELLERGQAKLEVGPAGDRFEQEADRVAASVVARLRSGDEAARSPSIDTSADPEVSRRSGSGGGPLDEGTERVLQSARGGGNPLAPSARKPFEDAFGADFSQVRLHTGGQATKLNRQLQARAFTLGPDIFLRDGAPDLRRHADQELLAHELTHTLQQGAGLVQASPAAAATVQRKEVTIGGEQVEVADDEEEVEAKDIIETLKTTYGLDVNSTQGVQAIKDQYVNVPTSVLDSLSTRKWRMVELRAVLETMKHYAAILGAEREQSTRKASPQEVVAVGKVTQAIDANTSAGKLDTSTLGEYFKANKTMNLFKAQEGSTGDFPGDESKQLVGTFVHEMAHGLLAYAYDDFVAATGGYWDDQVTPSGTDGVEAPITDYGTMNAREDLCETAMFYFVEPESLKAGRGATKGKPGNPAPLRYAFMQKVTNDWLPPPPPPPVVSSEPVTSTTTKPTKKKKKWYQFWKK